MRYKFKIDVIELTSTLNLHHTHSFYQLSDTKKLWLCLVWFYFCFFILHIFQYKISSLFFLTFHFTHFPIQNLLYKKLLKTLKTTKTSYTFFNTNFTQYKTTQNSKNTKNKIIKTKSSKAQLFPHNLLQFMR